MTKPKKPEPKAEEVLSAEELLIIQRKAYGLWEDVASDLLRAVADSEGKNVNTVTIPRCEVVEVVLDADRLNQILPEDLRKKWKSLSYDEHIRIVTPVFHFERYGM